MATANAAAQAPTWRAAMTASDLDMPPLSSKFSRARAWLYLASASALAKAKLNPFLKLTWSARTHFMLPAGEQRLSFLFVPLVVSEEDWLVRSLWAIAIDVAAKDGVLPMESEAGLSSLVIASDEAAVVVGLSRNCVFAQTPELCYAVWTLVAGSMLFGYLVFLLRVRSDALPEANRESVMIHGCLRKIVPVWDV